MKTLQKIVNQIFKSKLSLKQFHNKKILVTGCNGFIASTFIRCFSEAMNQRNLKIFFYGISRNKKINKYLKPLILKKNLMIKAVDLNKKIKLNFKPDLCFHCASITSPSKYLQKPIETIKTNLLGTINLLDFCVKKKVKKFIFLSSGEIYGNFGKIKTLKKFFNEDNYGIINPKIISSNYGLSKKVAENILISWSKKYGLKTNSIRLFHTYGPYMKLNDGRIHADVIGNIKNNTDIRLNGNLKIRRSFCYISDVITGILTVMIKGEKNESYNLANPKETYNVFDFAKLALSLSKNNKIQIKCRRTNNRLDYNYPNPSVNKLKKLGWSPKINIKQGLTDTINFYKFN